MNKQDLRAYNRTLPNGVQIYLGWIEDANHAVFQKEWDEYYNEKKTQWKSRHYGTIRVHKDDLTNGNFEYMIENNLTRFD